MTQSTIPYKMWREYHPKLTDCLIQDAHLDILHWFSRVEIVIFIINLKERAIFDISSPFD